MSYSQGQVDASQLKTLLSDLYLNWDDVYSAKKFPPAKNFLGKMDPAKNRHIGHYHIHKLPKVQQFVLVIKELIGNITVDSVILGVASGHEA